MSDSIHYITNSQGEKVGVLVDLETYQNLTNLSVDSELLTGLSIDELQALAESILSPQAQIQINDLLTKNSQNLLSYEETETLDRLLAQIDQLNILKTRARYNLTWRHEN